MAGDSEEVLTITKNMERIYELHWAPWAETGHQFSCWDLIPEGWTLGEDVQGARSHGMCCRRQQPRGP